MSIQLHNKSELEFRAAAIKRLGLVHELDKVRWSIEQLMTRLHSAFQAEPSPKDIDHIIADLKAIQEEWKR